MWGDSRSRNKSLFTTPTCPPSTSTSPTGLLSQRKAIIPVLHTPYDYYKRSFLWLV
jgi:hypothetical protein